MSETPCCPKCEKSDRMVYQRKFPVSKLDDWECYTCMRTWTIYRSEQGWKGTEPHGSS